MFWTHVINGVKILLPSMFVASSAITAINNKASNDRLERRGYRVRENSINSLTERFKYFVKDFLFLIVPFYNIIKSIKNFAMDDHAYDEIRISKLTDRMRLVKVNDSKKAESKTVIKREPKLTEEVKKEKEKTVEPVKEVTPMDTYKMFKKKYDETRQLYDNASSEEEKRILAAKISEYVEGATLALNEAKKEKSKPKNKTLVLK